MDSNWRKQKSILVAEAHTIGSIAVIRSLGRAGYRVVATSPVEDALGFSSRYCHVKCFQPPYEDTEKFLAWLNAILHNETVDLIIPSEGFLLAIRPWFNQFQRFLPVPSQQDIVYRSLSKCDLFQEFLDRGMHDHLPPFILVREGQELPTTCELGSLGLPLFLKVDGLYARHGSSGDVIRCETSSDASDQLKKLSLCYRKILVQGYVQGAGVGVFFARWEGRQLGEFLHRRIHEVPHTGGVSSLRNSWKHPQVLADAKARIALLGWEGVGMFEYRWDPDTDKFSLMEFNSRFWGSLHLALFADVDFPKYLVDACFGYFSQPVTRYPLIQCRLTFPREVEYVMSRLRDSTLPHSQKLWTLSEFWLLCFNFRMFSDLNFPGDRVLYWKMLVRSLRRFIT